MMQDLLTIVWKEWKEILLQRGTRIRPWMSLLVVVGVFGIYLPLQMGREWIDSPLTLVVWGWVPVFFVTSIIADSFAGERERHTLETLLASRLSDRAILFGKLATGVAYGFGLSLVCILLGIVAVNVVHRDPHGPLFFRPAVALGIFGLCFLGAGLAATGGVLLSLRATSVRQVQQTIGIALMALIFLPLAATRALPPQWRERAAEAFRGASTLEVVLAAMGILAMIDAALLWAAMKRFRRARLLTE